MAKDAVRARLAALQRELKKVPKPKPTTKRSKHGRPGRTMSKRLKGYARAFSWPRFALGAAKVLAILVFPFLLYVRASVFFYAQSGMPWLAVAGGIGLTVVVLVLYATWLVHGVFGKKEWVNLARWVVAPIVGGWLLFSLLFLAKVNAKSDDVREWYLDLHPVLRVAVSTAILLDRDMVITDMQRVAADYPRMGLRVNNQTRHYIQKDGWVHAVDLRTNGRLEIRNLALQFYFWSMGFSTTRHVGTADHLHVQLRPR